MKSGKTSEEMGDCIDVGHFLKRTEETFAVMGKTDDHPSDGGFSPLAYQWFVPN
jgi:hypothetical protein